MTQEEAIKILKDFHDESALFSERTALETLYPEFKESEDKKVRKEIVEYLKKNLRLEWATWLEKQGEQKPADKVEPKFHEGEWVVQGYNILKIKCVGDTHYCFETVGGYVDDMLVSEIDSLYHLWTIQDAKDGDVLACENGRTAIFKCLNDNLFSSYCFIDNEGWFCGDERQMHMLDTIICGEIHPATKEQRDLLFQKMKEAGYEWDAKKKKLSRRVIDEGKAEMDYCFTKMMNGEKVSPIWSEEDEKTLNSILNDLSQDVIPDDEDIQWLKSLKERMKGE